MTNFNDRIDAGIKKLHKISSEIQNHIREGMSPEDIERVLLAMKEPPCDCKDSTPGKSIPIDSLKPLICAKCKEEIRNPGTIEYRLNGLKVTKETFMAKEEQQLQPLDEEELAELISQSSLYDDAWKYNYMCDDNLNMIIKRRYDLARIIIKTFDTPKLNCSRKLAWKRSEK